MTAALFLIVLLALIALGMPIAFALLFSGVAIMLQMGQFDSQVVVQNAIGGADNFVLMAVPFFILAGELMTSGGISRRIIDMAQAWVGHIRGGLGYVAIGAAVLMASMSGSALADTAALATILLPMMRQQGYPMNTSAGLIASGGIIAPIIPPSLPFVIYGVTTNTSISSLFLAGIVPGIIMGVGLIVAWKLVLRSTDLPEGQPLPMKERLRATAKAFWALLMPIIIIGGMKTGIFTPTEAAVVAAVYALFVAMVVYRELSFRQLADIFQAAARTSAVVMFLVAAAMVSAWLITVADLPSKIIGMLEPFMDNQTLLLIAIMLLVMIVGTAMDMTPTILILTPVLMPVVKAAGIDPVYFGVLFIINNAIGLITPPVGTVLNVVAGVGRISMSDVTRGVMPFMLAQFIVMFLLVAFPSIVMVPLRWLGG